MFVCHHMRVKISQLCEPTAFSKVTDPAPIAISGKTSAEFIGSKTGPKKVTMWVEYVIKLPVKVHL